MPVIFTGTLRPARLHREKRKVRAVSQLLFVAGKAVKIDMKAAFFTLGCKVNRYESEYMAELLSNAGFEIVSPKEQADYYIINSCTVTATANQKTRQNIRKFKRNHPGSIIILTGCMPQAFPEEAAALQEADIVIGNKNTSEILTYINQYQEQNQRFISVLPHQSGDAFRQCSIRRFHDRIRAFVKIEDGCDRFCSYCIIPKSRGRVRSKSPADLKKEISDLAGNGIKEIVLVGINLSAYGKNEDFNLVDAAKIAADCDGIIRVRLGSLEPDHITQKIICELAKINKLCPQFHISLQSGCNKTLKNMNRHYTAQEYAALCRQLREAFPDASITTDVMVGFHEETQEDFLESLHFVQSVAFEKVHVFPYSERQGTAAAQKGDSVSKAEKEKRAALMIEETDKIRADYFKTLIGKRSAVLFENKIGENLYQGYTVNYTPVQVTSLNNLIGLEQAVTITGCCGSDYCIAE